MSFVKELKLKTSSPKESLAEAIANVSNGFSTLLDSGLNKKAIVVLLQAETRLSQKTIVEVLDALPKLKGRYCK